MKQFISNIKNLSQKAAEIKAAMQQVPPKVAEIREAVAATTGQLQQLKAEIHYSVADLKADDEDRLTRALQELNNSLDVFARAGFAMSGVDFEISPVQRMLVRLTQIEEVHASVLRTLATANQPRRIIHAILAAILQAKQMAETIEFTGLHYAELLVGIGPIPSVRICWRPAEAMEVPAQSMQTFSPATASVVPVPATSSLFGPGSLLEKPSPLPAPIAVQPVAASAPSLTPSPVLPAVSQKIAPPPPELASGEKADPLARFRRMPDLTKRH